VRQKKSEVIYHAGAGGAPRKAFVSSQSETLQEVEPAPANSASLLLLIPEETRSLPERLAAIEEQFLATGIIELEASTSRQEDGEEVFYRRYRLTMGGAEEGESALALHQYSFWRADVQILLQVESPPESFAAEDLFFRIFQTLEIHEVPDPFVFEDPMERG